MESNYNLHSLSCIAFFLLLNLFQADVINARAEPHPPHQHDVTKKTPQTLDYLKNLVGTRKGNTAKGLSHLKNYLSNLGYMNIDSIISKPPPEQNNDSFDENLELAVRAYQSFFKLKVTGVLDAPTVNQMMQPRCGVADNFSVLNRTHLMTESPVIAKHYTFFPGKPVWWPGKTDLTYSFPAGASYDLDEGIFEATGLWNNNSIFKFAYIKDYDKADVKISFQVWDHGDRAPFDGPGGILAHAFAPTDGRLHFDGSEKWVDGVKDGAFDVQSVGLHELGHVLGLGHSADINAVMWPTFQTKQRKGLGQDDIDGIKALYPS
ncbi:hypothetical protein ABFX02_04G063300 [Erythranthe guttata]